MGRRGYPPEFRRRVLEPVEAGRRVADVARDLGISEQSVYVWRRHASPVLMDIRRALPVGVNRPGILLCYLFLARRPSRDDVPTLRLAR